MSLNENEREERENKNDVYICLFRENLGLLDTRQLSCLLSLCCVNSNLGILMDSVQAILDTASFQSSWITNLIGITTPHGLPPESFFLHFSAPGSRFKISSMF